MWLWSRLVQAWLALDDQIWTSNPRKSVPTRGALSDEEGFAFCHHDSCIAALQSMSHDGLLACCLEYVILDAFDHDGNPLGMEGYRNAQVGVALDKCLQP